MPASLFLHGRISHSLLIPLLFILGKPRELFMKQANNQATSESRTCQATRCHAAFACRWPSTSNHPKKSQRTKQLKLPGTSISHGARQRIDRSSSFELVSSTGACLSSQQFARPPPPLQERHGEGFQGPGNRRRLQNREEEQQHQRGLAQPCSTIELPTSRQADRAQDPAAFLQSPRTAMASIACSREASRTEICLNSR